MALYLRLLAASFRARLQYKWDFLINTLLNGLLFAIDFLIVAAIVLRYPLIGSWNLYEIALLAGVSGAAYGLVRIFAAELYYFEKYLVTGEFDQCMIRPWPTLLSVLARNFDFGRFGAVLQGFLILGIGLKGVLAAGAPWWILPYSLTLPLAGAVTLSAILIVTDAIGFFIIRIDELLIFTVNAPATAANFPASIFPSWLRRLLIGVLPVATIAYLPFSYVLGKAGSPLLLLVPYGTAAVALPIALVVWRWGERHYQSTGT